MKNLISLAPLILMAASVVHANDSSWEACKKDSDCLAFKGCCGYRFINKSFRAEVEAFENGYCPQVECQFLGDSNKTPSVGCVKKKCEKGQEN